MSESLSRRNMLSLLAGGSAAFLAGGTSADEPKPLLPKFILASALYGTMDLDTILGEVSKISAEHIDIWPKVHGNQREQIKEMGEDAFAALLKKHAVKLGVSTSYALGPFGLKDELNFLKKFGGSVIVTGTPAGDVASDGIKPAMKSFLEKMKPHADAAGESGVVIALENHAKALLNTPDSLRAFADLNRSPALGIAFAPHHLHPWAAEIPALINDLGKANLAFFYAQEHGKGFMEKLAKADEMQQMPGFGGGLDYVPIFSALKKIGYAGFIEIFMHPTPRGVPILPTASEITAAINTSRAYLEKCAQTAQ